MLPSFPFSVMQLLLCHLHSNAAGSTTQPALRLFFLLSLVLCFDNNTNIKTLLIWQGRNKSRERMAICHENNIVGRLRACSAARQVGPTRKDCPRNPIIGRSHITCVSVDSDVAAAEPARRRSRPRECTSGPIDHLLSAMMASPVDICAPPVGPPCSFLLGYTSRTVSPIRSVGPHFRYP